MISNSPGAERRYPTRRELRLQQERVQTSAPAQDFLSQHLVQEAITPVTPHRPQSPEHPVKSQGASSTDIRRRPGRLARLVQTTAALSTGALALAFALPATVSPAGEANATTGMQHLTNSTATEALAPSALEGVEAATVGSTLPNGFFSLSDSEVIYPFTDPVVLTDGFGYRSEPVAQFHAAQDFGAAAGTPIWAIAGGTVSEADFITDACGFALEIAHEIDGKEVRSRYCHMQYGSHSWEVGDTIEQGELVGRVGNTGLSFGAHLHLVIYVDGAEVDPMVFLDTYSRIPAKELSQ